MNQRPLRIFFAPSTPHATTIHILFTHHHTARLVHYTTIHILFTHHPHSRMTDRGAVTSAVTACRTSDLRWSAYPTICTLTACP
ncbi:MAG: hypothetical protein IJU35_08230 [Paludibacteraceae bacterium]|nr:hypothetical protein [Paludibacteraceae bacterium]